MRWIICLALLASLPAAADTKTQRVAIVAIDAPRDDDAARALSTQISAEMRRLIVGKFGPYRLAVANADPGRVHDLPLCKSLPRCLAIIGAEVNADFVIYGSVMTKDPGFLVRLMLVDVKTKRLVRIENSVFWQDPTEVTRFRNWVRMHYAKLMGARSARSS